MAQFIRLPVRQAISVTNIVLFIKAAATATLADSYVALVNEATGAVVGVSADQSSAWEIVSGSTNVVVPLASGPFTIQPGSYYAVVVSTATSAGAVQSFGQYNNYNGNTTNAAGTGIFTNATRGGPR